MAKSIINRKYLYEYLAVFAVSLLFLALGLVLGTLSPLIVMLKDEGYREIPPISNTVGSWILNSRSVGVVLGAFISTYASEIHGRKVSMLISTIPQILAHILMYFATNVWMIYISFGLQGTCVAMIFAIVPTYVSEITSAKVRGPSTIFGMLMLPIGGLIGGMIQAKLSISLTSILLGAMGLCCLPCLCFIPESPYFYVSKQRDEDCKKTLRKLRQTGNVEKELIDIQSTLNAIKKTKNVSWSELFTKKLNLRVFLICAGVQTIQQTTGYTPISGYSHDIVMNSGLNISLFAVTIIIHCVTISITVVSMFTIETFGRRLQYMTVCTMCILGLGTLGTSFFLEHYYTSIVFGLLKFGGILVFSCAYSFGFSFLPNLLSAELFPTDIKSKGVSGLMLIQSLASILVTSLYDSLYSIADYLPFWVFFVITVIGLIFGYFFVPETKQQTLADIQKQLNLKT